ncbi:tannase/feruloyl esterase family alpha/beta hydrolase [Streptomyces flavidovirens]|uniref:tannase/feruloyl esterase family alpha/beta hydrolase n=1 Tax=Streptomyces flavidovirens TaxID=67298 RepID=UPI003428CAA1
MFDATNPDLSALAAKNHKLILFQPSADNAASTPMVSAYYRSVVARMGKAKADKVMRFFVGSGGHHTTGPSKTDFLTVLEHWVLEGEEPPNAVTSYEMDSTTGQVLRSLPSCRYPMYARYVGGDPKSPAGFRCTDRSDPLDFVPEAR